MTGVKVRVQRKGQWVDVDVDELGSDEWEAMLRNAERFGKTGWTELRELVKWVKAQRSSPG